ncbi:MAG: thiamine biosynthesis protein ThiI [Oceanicoccus sp.]|jgi:thiamine biosynthesis protein ThiI
MQFIIKFFPEITIKSRPVRKQFIKQLRTNLRILLKPLHESLVVESIWDKMTVRCDGSDPLLHAEIVEVLSCASGIAHFLDVMEFPFVDKLDAYEKTQQLWGDRLVGQTFVVRCKRIGKHDFTSHELEQYIGGGLHQHSDSLGVDLHNPDVTVRVELRDDRLFIVNRRYAGLGGYPLGCLDPVLSLISGGFDSTVSTYMTMKRGMRTHFCFFNLGGRGHEIGVKEVALYLWMKFGASSRVKFVSVPFEGVVSEILKNVDNAQMGVILKRMMLRAGEKVADHLFIEALVTGEAIAQVSSQTIRNLNVIDSVTDKLVLRPIITYDKDDIISISRQIGTEKFAAVMPEYCGVISVKPTTRAKPERIEHEETKFDFAILDKAIADASYINIDEISEQDLTAGSIEVLSVPVESGVIIDVRHPAEEERNPLVVPAAVIEKIPFYDLHARFVELDKSKTYLLYCDKGVMSKLHASYLVEKGHGNVKVYRPRPKH